MLNSLIVSKVVRKRPFERFLNIHFVAKYEKKLKWDPSEITENFRKKNQNETDLE